MSLEVGMYVRTNKGIFEKLDDVLEFDGYEYYLNFKNVAVLSDTENSVVGSKGKITKASYNIIDLIEVGDYVNGYKVINFDETYFNGTDRLKEPKKTRIVIDNGKYEFENRIKNDDIKSIVTKEQFESISYKVEENNV
ncbi:MAG: hypothetical protein HFJ12_01465 [Bacilli bacterium]|nr:hypothetical protein [Bacilli bacterium]